MTSDIPTHISEYYENCQLKESIDYDAEGNVILDSRYYEDGTLLENFDIGRWNTAVNN